MVGNFARAGPTLACFALVFMAFANTYSSIVMSAVMLRRSTCLVTSVNGAWGRLVAICALSHKWVPLLDPRGSIARRSLPGHNTWTVFMALMVLPVCLKEGSGAAFAGCFGTILADIIGVAVVMYGMRGHPSVPFPGLKFEQVANMIGNLSLAYGAGIIIPDLQRQHSDASRMPRVVPLFDPFQHCLLRCGLPDLGEPAFTIYPDSTTGMTSLGFKPMRGVVVMTYLFMQLHITIAFSVILNPAFYIAERLLLSMHKTTDSELENGFGYEEPGTPVDPAHLSVNHLSRRSSKMSFVSVADSERVHKDDEDTEAAEYTDSNFLKYVALRITIVVILVIVAIVFKDHFSEFSDFIGASCITTNCILLPIIFYFMKAWVRVPIYEKIAGIIVLFVCTMLGCYVTYTTGKELFFPSDNVAEFPFCDSEYENKVYYNYTATHQG